MKAMSVMDRLARYLLPGRTAERALADDDERRLTREAIDRANRVADTWNERTRDNWRADGDARPR